MHVIESLPISVFVVAVAGASLLAWACHAHRKWQERVERERFVLAMKAASTPDRLAPEERDRLQLLREPWWAVWRWLPEELGHSDAGR
jgi:hypothetical protein